MKIKIQYNELNDISTFVNSKYEELESTYNEINKTVESLPSIWQGKDSKEFVEEATKKINSEIERNKLLKTFGENLKTVSNDFSELESNWYESVKRESLDNG